MDAPGAELARSAHLGFTSLLFSETPIRCRQTGADRFKISAQSCPELVTLVLSQILPRILPSHPSQP